MHILNSMFPGSSLPPAPLPSHARQQNPTLGMLPQAGASMSQQQLLNGFGALQQQPQSSQGRPVQTLLDAHK